MAAQPQLFLCLKDNFGVLLHDPGSGATASIDAPEARAVEAALRETGWDWFWPSHAWLSSWSSST